MVRILGFLLCLSCVLVPSEGISRDVVPYAAQKYKKMLTKESYRLFGLNPPVARFAAQITQESGWNPKAKSIYAAGLAQFTPDTADWISKLYKSELGLRAPYSPSWAIKALILYDKRLLGNFIDYKGYDPIKPCDRWALVLSAYNGGLGWTYKDRKLAKQEGKDPNKYWGNVNTVNAGRSEASIHENRGYPKRILKRYEKVFFQAGWTMIPPVCGEKPKPKLFSKTLSSIILQSGDGYLVMVGDDLLTLKIDSSGEVVSINTSGNLITKIRE